MRQAVVCRMFRVAGNLATRRARAIRWSAMRNAMWKGKCFVGAALIVAGVACQSQREQAAACAGDADCSAGLVCRVARCRKTCPENHWVGEAVSVKASKEKRAATISGCDEHIWVRYESGIEEQVDAKRVSSVHGSQASVKSDRE